MSKSPQHPGQHRARKRFGQNFLNNPTIIDRIVRHINPQADDRLVEIGPGKGAITHLLLDSCPALQVIELDRDLIPILLAQFAKYRAFKIHQHDALAFDYEQLMIDDRPLRIVGNLPYNISTPLIFHLLTYQQRIQDMHFMLQKEVVERLAATPGDKHYGRLSVMVQYYCEVDNLFHVPPESFTPQPKVDSAIVRLQPHRELPHRASNPEHLSHLVNTVFQQRRKTLRNTLKPLADPDQLAALPIDTNLRAENLSVAEFVDISNRLLKGDNP